MEYEKNDSDERYNNVSDSVLPIIWVDTSNHKS